MATPSLLRLVYRNVRVNTDPASLVILIGLPAMYLVFFGLGFGALAGGANGGASYREFLTPGIMAYQAVMAGTVAGSMLWADRRWGMLAQLLVGPFTRLEYLLSNIVTAAVFGLGGAVVMLGVAVALFGLGGLTLSGALVMFAVIAVGSVMFGALMLFIAALVKSNNAYNSIQILLIFLVSFASTVFYPNSPALPAVLRAIFVVNPLTYIADAARGGYFGNLSGTDLLELAILGVETVVFLGLATRAYQRSDVSME